MISQILFTSEQPKKNKMDFVRILSQMKLLFGPLVIQLVWYTLKQSFASVSVKVVDIYSGAPAALGRQAEPHKQPIYGKQKETHELIFSWLSCMASGIARVGAYARRRRRWSRARWLPYFDRHATLVYCVLL